MLYAMPRFFRYAEFSKPSISHSLTPLKPGQTSYYTLLWLEISS